MTDARSTIVTSIRDLSSALVTVVPELPVLMRGSWSTSSRKVYESAGQAGSGSGPFREVVDARWSGSFECEAPLAALGFLVTAERTYWGKSAPAVAHPLVHVSLHAYANYDSECATFAAGVHGLTPPSLPFPCGNDLIAACSLGPRDATTGQAHQVARVEGAAFVVILLPASVLTTGRNRLWRLRDDLASNLPSDLRGILTRGRTGAFPGAE